MADRLDDLDYYRLLGVSADASTDAIREAFHAFALLYHPDRHVGRSAETIARAHAVYRRGAEAYRTLCDPVGRRVYDEALRGGVLRMSPEAEAPTGATGGFRSSSLRPPKLRNTRARPLLQQAEAAISRGDWKAARLHLQIALHHEPESELLKQRLAAVEAALSASRPPD